MSSEKPVMIEFRDVHKYYGDYHALRGINATIRAGEFFSLLGPSGCGKTTLLRTIAGFEGISSGAVMIGGEDMADVPANERPTNMVFQSYAIFPHLTVEENVGFGLRKDERFKIDATDLGKSLTLREKFLKWLSIRKTMKRLREEKAKAVEEALSLVGLSGYGGRAAHALSGGQRQRVALARALTIGQRLLLLDEPFEGVAPALSQRLSEVVGGLRGSGLSVLISQSDQNHASSMLDPTVVIERGANLS